jgi:hypothetical protein
MGFRIIGSLLFICVLFCGASTVAQERFGGLSGVITDPSASPVPGATVTATNSETGAVRTTVSGADGTFRILDLEPGRYTVSVELSGFQKVQANDVLVFLGRTADLPVRLSVGALTEVVNVTGESPIIDLTTTTIAHNVTAEELARIPKTRTFQDIALVAPSVNQGSLEGGIQVNGASGAENSYTVDGVVTNSAVNGSARQNAAFEYLQEVQVKTTGVPAEYGGALGGVVSAVTKSGGNTFQGEGHYYYFGSGLSAAPVKRLVLDPNDDVTVSYFQDDKQPDHNNEFGGSVGGPIIRDRLFFFGSVSPRVVRQTNNYQLAGGGTADVRRRQTLMQGFGKISVASPRANAYGTVLYTPSTTTGTLFPFDGAGPNAFVSTSQPIPALRAIGYESNQVSTTGNLDVVAGAGNFVTVKGGYFHDNYRDTNIPATGSYTYQTSAIGLPFAIPASLLGGVNTFNSPRLENRDDTTNRGYVNLDYTHSLTAGGRHDFKGGVGFQRTINDVTTAYPNGFVYLFWNSAFTSNVTGATGRGQYGYYEVNDRGTVGRVGANMISLYAQDQWSITPKLSLNLGLRTERESVPNFTTGGAAFTFSFAEKLAPRLGAAYDVRGDGRMKVYGSWGRYFDWTKYELSRGSFGGDFWHVYYRSLDTLDVGNLGLANMPGRDLWGSATGFRNRRVNSVDSVDPDIKPMSQDSTSIGLEFQPMANTVVGVHYVHNDLRRTIEDIGALDANGDEAYVIGNPGEFLSELEAPSGRTPRGQPMPKAKRQYDAVELSLTRRYANGWFFSGSYTYSRLYGNYPGISSSDEIRTPTTNITSPTAQNQLGNTFRQGGNVNRAWDIDYLNWDSHGTHDVRGRLATDRPHVVKLYGSYQLPVGTQVGAFFYGGSGTPVSTYVMTSDQIPVFVEGRGDLGRTPVLTRTDVLVAHEFNMMQNRRIRIELNVLNVFNQKTATHFYNQLNRGPSGLPRQASAISMANVDLTKGYDYNALIRATADGLNAYDPRFRQDDLFNPGTQGQLSVKFVF